MNRFFAALIAMTFVVAVGGASTIQPAQSATKAKAAAKSEPSKKATKKAAKKTKGKAATEQTFEGRLAKRWACREAGLKQGLYAFKLWDYVGNCIRS